LLLAIASVTAITGQTLITPAHGQTISGGRLPTRWDKDIPYEHPWAEYPRPQMVRDRWLNLNGPWDYALTDSAATKTPLSYTGKILVPYPYESALSGIQGGSSVPGQRLWYRRFFTIPESWKGDRVLLHFGAVNWDSSVFVNDKPIGTHRGGYDGMDYDITGAILPGQNALSVSAWNPVVTSGPEAQVTGKQRLKSEGYAYTASTGIWQTVWLEPVPRAHITNLKITPDIDSKVVSIAADTMGTADQIKVTAADGASIIATTKGASGTIITLPISNPHLWSPGDPHLYGLKVTLLQNDHSVDTVSSYFAMRKVSLGKDELGRTRIFLNDKFLLQIGALDQGYWPDGIYTAPTDAAQRNDIEMAKRLGLNLLRKHAKVEPDRWYYWTDRIGMLVWQDMPQTFGDRDHLSDANKQQWLTEFRRMISTHYNHPSIIVWTLFNENWGEHDVEAIAALTKEIDPTRLVNDASGFVDKGVGDIVDAHDYPGPGSSAPEANRAAVNGEFGDITMLVPDHRWDSNYVGYGGLVKNSYQFDKRYLALLKAAYKLSDSQGTSAFVYTQLTDVEEESNGLLTYDRAVVKPDLDFIAAANRGSFIPLPANPDPPLLVPTSEEDPQIWSYTTLKPADDWAQPAFDSSAWKTGPAPFGQGYTVNTAWTDTPGDIWMRRAVTLPVSIPANLEVVTIHDEDVEVYINGVLAASAPGYVGSYVNLPITAAARAAMHPGQNVICAHCHQTTGGQVIDVGIAEASK